MLAVIKTGGKQYKVKVGERLKIEKIEAKVDEKIAFNEVLLWSDGTEVKIGKPTLENAKVEAKVVKQRPDKKVIIIKHNAKKRYKKKQGHRQLKTEVEITDITAK